VNAIVVTLAMLNFFNANNPLNIESMDAEIDDDEMEGDDAGDN